jgi:hypothetical protein
MGDIAKGAHNEKGRKRKPRRSAYPHKIAIVFLCLTK